MKPILKLKELKLKDPSFGMNATWVLPSQQNEAEEKGYVVVAPESVLATHLSQIFYKHSGKLIGQDDVQTLLDNLSHKLHQVWWNHLSQNWCLCIILQVY